MNPPRRCRILLLGNYEPDAQQSMLRFGALLRERLARRGHDVTFVAPAESRLAGRLRGFGRGWAKWAGYLDKYVLFPRRLARDIRGAELVHVVDHSNALYLPRRRGPQPWVVTCHDLLAVRGALGEDTDCPASGLGRRLQRSIVAGLSRAAGVACDSTSTLNDLRRLVPLPAPQARRLILLGVHHPYQPIEVAAARQRLAGLPGMPWTQPFLLHVGSSLRRKNRAGVLRVLARLRGRWPGNVVFCGGELTPELAAAARADGVADRVFAVAAPDNAQLEAAYACAHALVFPSKCEGFGWPVIEAQACGCPVICSDRTSLPEVAGPGALVFDLADEAGMADAVVRLLDGGFRARLVQAGLANVKRFTAERMIDDYIAFYEQVLRDWRLPA